MPLCEFANKAGWGGADMRGSVHVAPCQCGRRTRCSKDTTRRPRTISDVKDNETRQEGELARGPGPAGVSAAANYSTRSSIQYIISRYFQCCSQLQYAQFQSLQYLEVLPVLQPITVRAPIYNLNSSTAANYSTQSLYLASPQGSRYFRRLCEICQASAAEAPMGDCPHLQYGVSVCVCVWPGNAIGDYFLACSRVTSRRKSNMTV